MVHISTYLYLSLALTPCEKRQGTLGAETDTSPGRPHALNDKKKWAERRPERAVVACRYHSYPIINEPRPPSPSTPLLRFCLAAKLCPPVSTTRRFQQK